MAVSSTGSKIQYSVNGVTTEFPFPYLFFDDSQLVVLGVDSLGVTTTYVLGPDYSVTGAGSPSGGTVTFVIAPVSGVTLTIYRNIALTQLTNYVNDASLDAEVIEADFDRAAMRDQQLAEGISRCIQVPVGSESIDPEAILSSIQQAQQHAIDTVNAAAGLVNGTATKTFELTAAAGQTDLVVSGFTLPDSTDNIEVYIAGIKIPKSLITRTNDTTVTLGFPLSGGEAVEIRVGVQSGSGGYIAPHQVTNALAAQMPAYRLKGNNTNATADAADLTPAQVRNLLSVFGTDSGAVNAYVVNLTNGPTALVAGQKVEFIPTNANTGAATLNFCGLGTVSIKKNGNQAIVSGDLPSTQIAVLEYDGAYWQVVSPIPSALTSSSGMLFTSSGTFTVPAGVTTVQVEVCGGAGGHGGAGGNPNAGAGGNSSFGAYVIAGGGTGGIRGDSGGTGGSGGSISGSVYPNGQSGVNGGSGGSSGGTGGKGAFAFGVVSGLTPGGSVAITVGAAGAGDGVGPNIAGIAGYVKIAW